MRTYTFNECYELLHVDPKTFRGWLKEAGIDPDHQVSRADRRIRFLTQAQLDKLAEEHGRRLSGPASHDDEVIHAGAFKLLLDRMQRAEEEIARHPRQIEESQQYVEDLVTKIQEEFKESRVTLDGRIADLTLTSTHQLNELKAQLQAIEHKVDQMAEMQASRLNQIEAMIQKDSEKVKGLREQLDAHSTGQATALGTLEASLTSIQAQQNDMLQQLGTLERDQARALAKLHSQLTKESLDMAEKITALEAEARTGKAETVEIKSRSDAQEHRLTELFRLIQEEIAIRQAGAYEVAQKKSPTRSKKGP
jgi:hypothetical protein